jgi:hypothetical protein
MGLLVTGHCLSRPPTMLTVLTQTPLFGVHRRLRSPSIGALAGSYAGHEHEVGSAGKVEEPKRSSSHGTGPQAHPVWAHPIRARRHRIRQRLLLCTAGDLVGTVKAAGSELSYQQRNRNGRGA